MILQTDMYRDYLSETRPMLIKLGPSMGAPLSHPCERGSHTSNLDPRLPPAVYASGYYCCLFVLLRELDWGCLPESLVRRDANAEPTWRPCFLFSWTATFRQAAPIQVSVSARNSRHISGTAMDLYINRAITILPVIMFLKNVLK